MSEQSATPGRIAIVDDDAANLESLERVFRREGLDVVTATDGREALDRVRKERVDVVLTDLMMPGMTGVDLLKSIKAVAPQTDVILMTAYGTVEIAVEAMKEGAYDFVTKPFKRVQIVRAVRRALERQSLLTENRALREQLARMRPQRAIIGGSPAIRRTLEMVQQVAPSSATVLLLGESGTGKELFARALHDWSARREGRFVAVNCAALPESILESELFGYERGAFTGAMARKEGRFSLADEGTLFLDEIGEMSPAVQVKLLRVLQEGEFERLGGTQPLRVNVRIIAATNKNLTQEVQERRFREDLFYRLNVITVQLPPLRDRREDIPLLAHHFLRAYCEKNQKALQGFTNECMRLMTAHDWPGNVRELENAVERGVVLARGALVGVDDIPEAIAAAHPAHSKTFTIELGTPLAEIEMRLIRETLQVTRGDKRLAAQLLGTSTRTIYRKLEQENAEDDDDEPEPDEGQP